MAEKVIDPLDGLLYDTMKGPQTSTVVPSVMGNTTNKSWFDSFTGKQDISGIDFASMSSDDMSKYLDKMRIEQIAGGMSGIDMVNSGIGLAGAVSGIMGTMDSMKNNKEIRQTYQQNREHAQMARADRTAFLNGTRSAFA